MVYVKDEYTRADITELIEAEECAFCGTCQECPVYGIVPECSDLTTEDVDMVMNIINKEEVSNANAINFAKVTPDAIIPTKKAEDAGYDIYACFDDDEITIKPLETKLIPTGIASALPYNYYFQIEERGSTGSKGIKKSAGVIDSDYRGEWFIALTNCNSKPVVISKTPIDSDTCIYYPYSKAIAQAVLHEVPQLKSKEISYEELKAIPSERGSGALGSSGK